jgi:hypothetical protein
MQCGRGLGHPDRAHVVGTGGAADRCCGVVRASKFCLVSNAKSGSNDAAALDSLMQQLKAGGSMPARHVSFPDEPLPAPAELDAGEIDCVAVFTGDGTIKATLDALAGWGGAVLVLPGGTMNLLYHRLHGDAASEEVIAAFHAGKLHRLRPQVIRCTAGRAYAGLLAGPGTAWNHVREAMREVDVVEIASGTLAALSETLAAPGVACTVPPMGRPEGYPLLLLDPTAHGIEVTAFHAEEPAEYLAQAVALLRRNFREGPHDLLGSFPAVTLTGSEGEEFGLLLDGEPAEACTSDRFELVRCEVDLLALDSHG